MLHLLLFVICLLQGMSFAAERKTLIVTGATGELGGASARALASEYDLILTGRNLDRLQKLQEELQKAHEGNYEIMTLDYTIPASRTQFANALAEKKKNLSGLLLVTPRPDFYGAAGIPDEKVWLDVIQKTFTAPLEVLKVALPHLANPSHVVVIAGFTSVQLQPQFGTNTCVIRRMWTSYAKSLSHELGSKGIRVNALSPSVVLTPFHQEKIDKKAKSAGLSSEQQMEKEVATIPLHKLPKTEDVAQAVKFLLSDQSDCITGVNLVLDCGQTVCY